MGKTFKRGFDMRDDDGIYTWKASRYPSVSKVLGPWSDFLFAHIFKVKEEVIRLDALDKAGLLDLQYEFVEGQWARYEADPGSLLRDGEHISKAGLRFMKRCADRGSAIDDMVMMYAQGMAPDRDQLPSVLEECIYGKSRSCDIEDVLPYAESYLQYHDEHQPDYVMGQVAVINDSLKYAGTPDYIRHEPGVGFVLQSLKTTNDKGNFERRWIAQEAFYANAEYGVALGEGNMGIEIELLELAKVEWLVLSPDSYRVRPAPIELLGTWFQRFCQPALLAYHAMKECPLPPTAKAVTRQDATTD